MMLPDAAEEQDYVIRSTEDIRLLKCSLLRLVQVWLNMFLYYYLPKADKQLFVYH